MYKYRDWDAEEMLAEFDHERICEADDDELEAAIDRVQYLMEIGDDLSDDLDILLMELEDRLYNAW